jgi:phenylalanyl-tRNA synthetase alpha subunit
MTDQSRCVDYRDKPGHDTVGLFPWRGVDAPPILIEAILQERLESAMAKKTKKTRKKVTAKAAKKSKALKKKAAKKKTAKRKTAITKKRRKVAAKKKPAPKKVRKPPPESFAHKVEHEVEDVVTEIADIFTDAERLHQKLDPGISREPE